MARATGAAAVWRGGRPAEPDARSEGDAGSGQAGRRRPRRASARRHQTASIIANSRKTAANARPSFFVQAANPRNNLTTTAGPNLGPAGVRPPRQRVLPGEFLEGPAARRAGRPRSQGARSVRAPHNDRPADEEAQRDVGVPLRPRERRTLIRQQEGDREAPEPGPRSLPTPALTAATAPTRQAAPRKPPWPAELALFHVQRRATVAGNRSG